MSTFQYGAQVHANGIRQHYLRYGGAKRNNNGRLPVIIVPGITSPAVTWGFVGERFGAHLDTYILDVRGRGLTEAGPDLDYSVDAQAADVVAFAQALGLSRYCLVGHSMGARIGARAAALAGPNMDRLVLVDPPVSGPGRRPYPAQLPWYVDSIALARHGMDLEGMRAFCPTWTDEQLHLRAQWLHTCNTAAVVRSFEDFHTEDFHQDLSRVTVPTLLIAAERGDVVRDEDVKEIETLVPDLRFVRVANAGHMIPWDNEEGFYEAFGDFLGTPLTA
ncbi:alpha/beta fold hydrolase [Bordetella genomosp. 4]|uniref:Alpha/beta hydrolase n=1 Tax=Bordetella genomosp. 4 TaxID=463044 RepID=A0A261U4Y9_9BORD|nr:alpha/beta hydrolase [Bordetella genomosp. 4]OZI48685.1 alpha/beta hydrolase [Bordetella genomosp. 4]OZI56685.1 alpha/beta hydrolase [Bordetella genomosp. 4]